MILTLFAFCLAAEQPTVPSVLSFAAAIKLRTTSSAIAVNGATNYFANIDCGVGLSNSVGLTVRDTGQHTLYVIVTVENMNGSIGGFVTLTLGDDNSDGTIDSIQGPTGSVVPAAATLAKAFAGVLKCYTDA